MKRFKVDKKIVTIILIVIILLEANIFVIYFMGRNIRMNCNSINVSPEIEDEVIVEAENEEEIIIEEVIEEEEEEIYEHDYSYTPAVINPVDQSKLDSDFLEFVEELKIAINNKDVDFFKNHMEEYMHYNFGDGDTAEGFIKEWELDTDPENSGFWDEISRVISYGFAYFESMYGRSFSAPYYFSLFPGYDYDAFEFGVVVGSKVNIRKEPSYDSEIIQKTSYSILEYYCDTDLICKTGEWISVMLHDGLTTGYIHEDFIKKVTDYRVSFYEKDGDWIMGFFIAGD